MAFTNSGNLINVTDNVAQGDINLYLNVGSQTGVVQFNGRLEHGMPFRAPKICGRDDEKAQLLLEIKKNKAVVITGVGGIGKTSLAIYSADDWFKTEIFYHILLLNCETLPVFEKSLRDLDVNGRNFKETSTEEAFRRILNEVNKKETLLIYDNVDSYDVIEKFIPSKTKFANVHVLATSQNRELKSYFKCFPIIELNETKSVEMIRSQLTNSDVLEEDIVEMVRNDLQDDSVKKLYQLFDGYPLGMSLACAHIIYDLESPFEDHDVNELITEYINEYEETYIEHGPHETDNRSYKFSVLTAIKMNLKKIQTEFVEEVSPSDPGKKIYVRREIQDGKVIGLIEKMKNVIGFGDPTEIKLSIFDNLVTTDVNKKAVLELLRKFTRFSLISVSQRCGVYGAARKEKHIDVHRTIQSAFRKTAESHEIISIVCEIIYLLTDEFLTDQIGFLLNYITANLITKHTEPKWRRSCRIIFHTPHSFSFVYKIFNELNINEHEMYLKILCQELEDVGNVWVFRECNEYSVPEFRNLFEATLTSRRSSLDLWHSNINELLRLCVQLGIHQVANGGVQNSYILHQQTLLKQNLSVPLMLNLFGTTNIAIYNWIDIHWFSWWGRLEKVNEILKENPEATLQPGWGGWTAIHVASLTGNVYLLDLFTEEQLEHFEDHGVDIQKYSAAFLALKTENYVFLEKLLELTKMTNINQVNTDGDTFLHVLIKSFSDRNNIDKLCTDKPICNILPYLSSDRYDATKLNILKLLLEQGAQVNIPDREGKTPIRWIMDGNKIKHNEAYQLLIEYGAAQG